jgi:hypothetical protein
MGTRIGDTTRAKSCDFVTREFLEDGAFHLYRKSDLADPACQWLVPWCQEDSLYPDRHPRVEVVGQFVKADAFCPRCGARNKHSLDTRGQVWEPGGLVDDVHRAGPT